MAPANPFPIVFEVDDVLFLLCGFTCHIGETSDNGHYIAYAKRNDDWYKFDDAADPEIVPNIQSLITDMGITTNVVCIFYNRRFV